MAVNHDYYLSYRIVVGRLVTRRLPEGHPRRSRWVREEHVPASEHEAQLDINLKCPALWRVVSNDERNSSGDPTSFQVVP